MWRYAIALSMLALLCAPNWAHAQFTQGDWALTLAGQGTNDKDFRSYDISLAGSASYFVTDQLEVGLRQGLFLNDGGSDWAGSTRGTIDYNFALDRWVPFVGVGAGYQYGESINDAWIGGPEVGVRFFANTTTFIQLVAGYDFELCHGLDTGNFVYGLAIGFKI